MNHTNKKAYREALKDELHLAESDKRLAETRIERIEEELRACTK